MPRYVRTDSGPAVSVQENPKDTAKQPNLSQQHKDMPDNFSRKLTVSVDGASADAGVRAVAYEGVLTADRLSWPIDVGVQGRGEATGAATVGESNVEGTSGPAALGMGGRTAGGGGSMVAACSAGVITK